MADTQHERLLVCRELHAAAFEGFHNLRACVEAEAEDVGWLLAGRLHVL
jgi:hypothetical protein